ncbi:sulfur carrier protein ThiS [Pseudoalteromonas sp. T1lg65]|uniref:sulfur carrier protein ThiS n=1 Tax=Pseudoalteromonas sp. T1lg65 TaxID=2077101 RepID=UPI003F7904C2
MNIHFNGERISVDTDVTILQLVEQRGAQAPYAVAVNGSFVPRSNLADTKLHEGDQVELLSPIQGG